MIDYIYKIYNQKLWHINLIDTVWFVLGLAIVFKGFEAPHHFHAEPEKYYFLYGTGKLLLNNNITIKQSISTVEIPSNCIHAMTPISNIVILIYYFPTGYFKKIKYNYTGQKLI